MPVLAQTGVSVPYYEPDTERFKRNVVNWCGWANQGHIANVGNVTLTSGTAQTVVNDQRVSNNSFIGFMPTTAKGLSAMPTVYVSTIDAGAGTFTITHGNSAAGNKTLRYCLLG